jgi:pimeloyl-ACP methyl ester carboxylesterase
MAATFIDQARASVARHLDLAFCAAALNPPKLLRMRSSAESLGHAERMRGLSAIAAFYGRPEFLEPNSSFFAPPRPIEPARVLRRKLGQTGEVIDLTWQSEFEPLWSRELVERYANTLPPPRMGERRFDYESDVRGLGMDRSGELVDKYFRARRNRIGHARWYRHLERGRPCVLLLHGYMGGSYALEERFWPVQQLFDAGLDVVISVLPFHGLRRSEARGFLPPSFPSSDPRFTIEGFRQLVFDHRALLAYLKRSGITSAGLMGMSLGGYSAALLATLESHLQFLVLLVPLASIEDFAHRHGRLTGTPEQQLEQRQAMRAAQWVVSPLARPSLLPADRVLVLAGASDAVTGRSHAEPLARHFGVEPLYFLGGHLLHFGRQQAFSALWKLLSQSGLSRAR